MATYRSGALTGRQQARPVKHVPDVVEGTCPECGTTSVYRTGSPGASRTFVRTQGSTTYICPSGHRWSVNC
jgi:predicted RNA-binding Zn-ribbon protein involved in translation (DUF1610 family)